MSVYIPFPVKETIGGPHTFMRNLQAYLDARTFPYQTRLHKAKALFFPISHPLQEIQKITNAGGRIIQRLDGIYYPSKHGEAYKAQNELIEKIYTAYDPYVVFQSEYSKAQCFTMFGKKPAESYTVITNGVHKTLFSPAKGSTLAANQPVRLISTGNFRNADMIAPVVNALDLLQTDYAFELHLVGPIPNQTLTPFFDRPYIRYHGSKTLAEIAVILKEQDIFIYSHLNPPCPNSVLEAISAGLPVVGFRSGAMAELCHFSTELLAYVSEDVFQQYEDFDPTKLAEKIVQCIDQFAEYKERALAYSHLYSFEECGAKYVKVFEEQLALAKPLSWYKKLFPFL